MIYTLVNKNFLIPEIIKEENLNILLQRMIDYCLNKDINQCFNIYIVGEQQIFFCKNNELYISENNIISKFNSNIPSIKTLDVISSFYNEYQIIKKLEKNVIHKNLDMDMDIKINKTNNILVEEEIKIDKPEPNKNSNKEVCVKDSQEKKYKTKSKEELELISLIEETMVIYQNEVKKIKDLERQIKIIDDYNDSLIKKKREKILTNFSKLKNDYKTFVLINRKKNIKPETIVPSLFELKYNYFKELINEEDTKILLDEIYIMNLDEVLNNKIEFDNKILLLSNKYGDESKKLNVKFDHSWEDLELETEPSEINNSKLG